MYNLLIAAGGAVLAYAAGALAVSWVAGFVPALLVFAGAWFFLARRTGKQVEAFAKAAMAQLQEGRFDAARDTLRSALPLGRWQLLVESQLYGQIGAIDYLQACSLLMQRQVTASKPHFADAGTALARSWSRDWRSRTMLACVHHRANQTDQAVAVMKAAESSGSGEAIFWAVYAFVLNEAKRRDEALQVVARGRTSLPKHAGLVSVQEALSNRKRPDFKVFGEPWYQFFPDQIPQEVLIEQARAAGKLPAAAANRSMKTWPQPRR
jgi:tetratricopeptide (TPR) repeat protein